MYWLAHPWRSVNWRCSLFSETPPSPISLVTKMKVASCAVNRSNSALAASSAELTSRMQVKKEIGAPQCDTINDDSPFVKLVFAQFFFFFDIGPLGSPILLMPDDALPEFIIPHTGCGQVDRGGGKAECHLFSKSTFAGPLSSGDEYDSFHVRMDKLEKFPCKVNGLITGRGHLLIGKDALL